MYVPCKQVQTEDNALNTWDFFNIWKSAGFKCGRSRVQCPINDRVTPKTLKVYQWFPCLELNIKKETLSLSYVSF